MKNLYFAKFLILISMILADQKASALVFDLHLGYESAALEESSHNDVSNKDSEFSDGKLGGVGLLASMQIKSFDAAFEYASLKPSNLSYLSSRADMNLLFGWFHKKIKFIAPIAGLYIANQSGDKDHESAPAAFLEKNSALSLGLKSQLQFAVYKKYELFFRGRFLYLTALEKNRNMGTNYNLAFGVAKNISKIRYGLFYMRSRTFFNGVAADKEVENKFQYVRSIKDSNVFGVSIFEALK